MCTGSSFKVYTLRMHFHRYSVVGIVEGDIEPRGPNLDVTVCGLHLMLFIT